MDRILTRRTRARRWLTAFPRAVPFAIFLLVMSIAAVSGFAIERGERRSQSAQLKERAIAVASALERRVNANAAYLRAGAALLSSKNNIEPDQFRSFVRELRLDTDYRGAEGIGWAARVDRDEMSAHNAFLAQEYDESVEVHPALASRQPFAVPVTFLEPDTLRNRRALGFDMYSEEVRRSAMVEAERMARPIASGKVVLEQEGTSKAPGFLIYMPVFESSSGRTRLKGFVYSAFNAQAFLSSVLQTEATGNLIIQIFDGSVRQDSFLAGSTRLSADGETVQQPFVIAGHRWVLVISRPSAASLSPLAIVTLVFGLAAAGLLALVAQILTQQAREDGARLSWFEEQNAIRDSLTRELNHRVKNTLANVLSIVALTRRRASSIDEFAEGLDGRIRALSATHDLLTQSDWGPTPIAAVIEAELAPYAREVGPTIQMTGPQIELAPSDALSLGLAIHELATNAAKYGALSVPGGKLTVEWKVAGPAQARIEWTESGGPPVPAQRGRGFGMDLIEKIVAHELQSPVKMDFAPEGLRCTLVVPVRAPRPFAIRSGA